jgi:hypothetical protein
MRVHATVCARLTAQSEWGLPGQRQLYVAWLNMM